MLILENYEIIKKELENLGIIIDEQADLTLSVNDLCKIIDRAKKWWYYINKWYQKMILINDMEVISWKVDMKKKYTWVF